MTLSTLPRRWRILLIGSLALNLLVAGALVGALLHGPADDRRRSRGEPLVNALPDTDRAALRNRLQRPDRDQRRARFQSLLAILRADPFDPDALRAMLTTERDLGNARARLSEDAIIARLAEMSLAERAAYAERLARLVRRGPERD